MSTVAYAAFTEQVDHNLDTAGPSEELQAAVAAGDVVAAMIALRQMVAQACGKAALLWTGSPVGTILRNIETGASATRAISPAGIPLWQVSNPSDGSKWESHEPVLSPEPQWVCIYNPDATE